MTEYYCDRCGAKTTEVDICRLSADHYVPSIRGGESVLKKELCPNCFSEIGAIIFNFCKEKPNGED